MATKKIISKAQSLYQRAYYAFHLNTLLSVTFNERRKDISKWINDREAHLEFFDDYKRLMVRTLAIELCVMFEESDRDRKKQYSIYSILQHFKNEAPKDEKFFIRPDQVASVNSGHFLIIKPGITLPKKGVSTFVANLLLDEYTLYVQKNQQGIRELKDIRDGYLAHPDANHEGRSIKVSHLIDNSEWCFSFASLILHLLSFSGGRPYVDKERLEFTEHIRANQNAVINDFVKL